MEGTTWREDPRCFFSFYTGIPKTWFGWVCVGKISINIIMKPDQDFSILYSVDFFFLLFWLRSQKNFCRKRGMNAAYILCRYCCSSFIKFFSISQVCVWVCLEQLELPNFPRTGLSASVNEPAIYGLLEKIGFEIDSALK